MNTKFNSMLVVLMIVTITACSGIPVSQDFEQGFDYSGFKTFAWQPDNGEWGQFQGNNNLYMRLRYSF